MSNSENSLKIISSSPHSTEYPYVLYLFIILTKTINAYLLTSLECYTAYIGNWLTMFQDHLKDNSVQEEWQATGRCIMV
jgi:hypothetical protein